MLKRRYGRIINISSIATDLHMKGSAAYAASKSAMVEFTKILAKELGTSGITCNVIALPLVAAGMSAELSAGVIEEYEKNLVMNRWATLDDICNVVGFLASPGSGLVTGQVINLGFVS
jgi:3-oxoacyl-[acyl-carrier protein] reductase